MNRRKLVAVPALMLMAAILMPAFLTAGKKRSSEAVNSKSMTAKSDYYLSYGHHYNTNDSLDIKYELYRRAHRINPASVNAGYYFASCDALIATDSLHLDKDKNLMRRYVDTYPEAVFENSLYASYNRVLMGDINESIRILKRLTETFPDNTDYYPALVEIYSETGDTANALNAVRSYEHIEGMSPQTVTTKVSLLLNVGDTASAFTAVDSLISLHPDEPSGWLLRADLFSFLQMPDSAMAVFQYAEQLAPYQFHTKMRIASTYMELGDTVQANKKMTEALRTNDLDIDDKIDGLYQFMMQNTNVERDIASYIPMVDLLLQQEPANLSALRLKSMIQESQKDYPGLYTTLREILAVDKKNLVSWALLLRSHVDAKDYDDIPALYKEAEEALGEKNMALQFTVALAYSLDNKYGQAASEITSILRNIVPSYTDTMAPAALADSLSSPDINKSAVGNYLQLLGEQYIQMKDTVTTLRIYDQALAIDPDNAYTLNNYAYYLALLGSDLDKALEFSKRTLNEEPENPTFLDTYAYILFLQKDYEKARLYQEMAIENTPDDSGSAELYEHYGDILFMLGDAEQALQYWKKALSKSPDNDLLKRKVEHETYFSK